jgi:methylated-DNA-[protein]-cysteine S-methyltransferase/AraC family transcriptional regulator of adaptative response/methylated-DNA-[protein]-cysteine methyltransferase
MNFVTPDFNSRAKSDIIKRYGVAIADDIEFAAGDCDLGKVLVARSRAGVCAIMLGSSVEELEQSLATSFAESRRISNEAALRNDLASVAQFIASPHSHFDFTLDIRGTPFQRRVWDALRSIPFGTCLTYSQLACRISGPKSLRAIAQACAENPIALAIPCHRVMGHSGSMAACRWGVARRRTLINREVAAV